MSVQDDKRETQLIELFDLIPVEGRSTTDAILKMPDGSEVEFELKSTTRGSVTTVRDFGPDHIKKWATKHWLIGVYELDGVTLKYSLYGSPKLMAPWIQEKAEYISADFKLAELLPGLVGMEVLHTIAEAKPTYKIEDARRLHKKQYTAEEYKAAMDVQKGYSPERMLSILQDRVRYLVERGSTLNNPHIPESYFEGWERITSNHAARLRELVAQERHDVA